MASAAKNTYCSCRVKFSSQHPLLVAVTLAPGDLTSSSGCLYSCEHTHTDTHTHTDMI